MESKHEEILFCTGGGCTAKLGAGALSRVLEKLPKGQDNNLLVGFDSHDDAAVYRINDEQAIVSTLDFFPPMVEDPYLFGQIAAANALSDIYAMGGRPLTALNIVCFPETLDLNLLGKILQGGNEKVLEAGALLAGGHSIVDNGVKYGLSVTGLVHPDRIYRNNNCQAGDVLILTKKLGVGIVCSANRVHAASPAVFEEATNSMRTLNRYAAEILWQHSVHACSDVTGFGFLVHLSEMLDTRFSAVIDSRSVPYFSACRNYVDEFYLTAAGQKNRNFLGDRVRFDVNDFAMEEILFDPQTSGGLLAAVPADEADSILAEMHAQSIPAAAVGQVVPLQTPLIVVQ
jgi:selenide,water dikinase